MELILIHGLIIGVIWVVCLTPHILYTAAPLSLCCTFAPKLFKFATSWTEEFIVNGKNQMAVTEFDAWGFIYPLMRQRRCTWIGAAIFFWGWVHQYRCRAILGSLRENTAQAEAYVVPEGDWFDYVSSAHYLAEIVANLTLAAADTHGWYHHKFDNYPSNRSAIIALVY